LKTLFLKERNQHNNQCHHWLFAGDDYNFVQPTSNIVDIAVLSYLFVATVLDIEQQEAPSVCE
jgi:hypothetical protein